ncbi:MAG: diguanylate cyclase [Candidatus Adiutrix sp.]|nr:diguanylate cyclase [Candidatus Adiutrix sp.]
MTKPLILVVEGDPVIGCVLAGALNRAGFDAEIFQDAALALESLSRLSPDMAVVDWAGPDCDGLGLVDSLKAKTRNLMTILFTGRGEYEAAEQARLSGRVDVVLPKPFNLAEFLNTVSACVNSRSWSPPPAGEDAGGGVLTGWLALDGREAYFEHILDSLIDAVMMVDRLGRIIYFNSGARRMFSFRDQSVGRLTLEDICPADNPLSDLVAHFFGPHPPVSEQSVGYFLKTGGTRFYTMFSASLFQAGNHGSAVLLVVKDLSASPVLFERTAAETRQLERLALTDPLTGLYNRRYFDQKLAEEFRRMERYGSPFTLLMMDFDHFKQVNDRFGHLVGDEVLRQGAEIFGRTLREVDTLFRWGGEEYMVLLPETGGEGGLAVARRLHRLIDDQGQWEKLASGLRVQVSMGLVSLPWVKGRPASLNDVLATLDRALYQAKKNGRNRIVRYRDDQDSLVEA